MSNLILFWHRRDLRISDNIGLDQARKNSPKIIGFFCLDPEILNSDTIAPARVKYLIGCLQELETNYQKLGSKLLITKGKPTLQIPKLATTLQAKAVYWNQDIEPYARQRDQQVKEALIEQGIETQSFWDQLLHFPGEILPKTSNFYTVYTPFWNNWHKQPKAKPVPTLETCELLTELTENLLKKAEIIPLPTSEKLGFSWDNPLLLQPGETAAKNQLESFCDQGIFNYQQERNFPGIEGTSQLSAALKFGAIGIRTIWEKSLKAMEFSRSEETLNSIITWQKELAWREFYQHALYFLPELAEKPYRENFENFPWENNEEYFDAWCQGKTGYPIVDAAMRQLNETGWMHNRCRMIVASFLTKDLLIDWRWGEKYFMQKLYDGDLAANNGGWQWSASCGLDPKPLRIFNPATQSQNFDPEGEYIRLWIPELSSGETEYLVTGKIPPLECHNLGYPLPIVEHRKQQAKFKEMYQQIK
jgi:deoxyribodipyrimidine photo-lyase